MKWRDQGQLARDLQGSGGECVEVKHNSPNPFPNGRKGLKTDRGERGEKGEPNRKKTQCGWDAHRITSYKHHSSHTPVSGFALSWNDTSRVWGQMDKVTRPREGL